MQNRNSTLTPAMQHGVTVIVVCLIITMQTSVHLTLFLMYVYKYINILMPTK